MARQICRLCSKEQCGGLCSERGHYVISSGHMWLPGCYESHRAAQYAFQFPDTVLRQLQESVNPGGIITMSMLKTPRKREAIMPEDEVYILGDIEAFLAALETGTMQEQWAKEQLKCQEWMRQAAPPAMYDASED